MKIMNANDARKLAESKKVNRMDKILNLIEQEASKGRLSLDLNFPLNETEKTELSGKGFKIEDLPYIAQQKDGDYVKISW